MYHVYKEVMLYRMVAIKANLVGVEKALFMKLGVIEPIKQILHRQLGFMVDMKVEVS